LVLKTRTHCMQRLSGQPHCGISTYRMSALGRCCRKRLENFAEQ
jgi:hypothetical protein